MSYEIPLPKPELLRDKPLDAREVMDFLVKEGFRPIAVTADNNLGGVIVHFAARISDEEAKRLMELVTDFYRKRVGLRG